MAKRFMVRQGDILIVAIDTIPDGAKKADSLVLAYGEKTGHSHVIDRGEVWAQDSALYLRLEQPGTITHPEHAPITVPAGTHEVKRQREYVNPEMETRVFD